MFAIAEFQGEKGKEIATIHLNWIKGDKCYWPNFWREKSKLKKAIKTGEKPNLEAWKLYPYRIVGGHFYDSYEKAQQALSAAEFTSELSSDENRDGLRKRHQVEFNESDSEDESEVPAQFITPKSQRKGAKRFKGNKEIQLTTPPSFPQTSGLSLNIPSPNLYAVSCNEEGHPESNQLQSTNPQDSVNDNEQLFGSFPSSPAISVSGTPSSIFPLPPTATSSVYSESVNQKVANTSSQPGYTQHFFPSGNEESVSNTSAQYFDFGEFIKTTQTNQQLILAKQDIIMDLLRTILQGRNTSKIVQESDANLSLPFSSVTDFKEFESKMKSDVTKRNSLVTILETTGGSNPNQVVYRVMAELMTDDLMTQYTFKGHTGKECFKDTLFFTCVTDAVKRQPKGQAMLKKEIEEAVDYWLRKATTRINKRSKKMQQQALSVETPPG